MRFLIFLFLPLLVNILPAQEPLQYEEVVQVDSLNTKAELYKVALSWVAAEFQQPNEGITLPDPEMKLLICKGSWPFSEPRNGKMANAAATGYIHFMVKLEFKDGRYKYLFSDFEHVATVQANSFGIITDAIEFGGRIPLSGKKWRQKVWQDIKNDIGTQVSAMQERLETKIKLQLNDKW